MWGEWGRFASRRNLAVLDIRALVSFTTHHYRSKMGLTTLERRALLARSFSL
ncbi:hypothetical protein M3J09_012469 [Ascochyta lentis]